MSSRSLRRHPFQQVYFADTMLSPAMYRVMAKTLALIYPNADTPTPPEVTELLVSLRPAGGEASHVVRVGRTSDYSADDLAHFAASDKPEIRFYLKVNPRFAEGYALLTVMPVSASQLLLTCCKQFRAAAGLRATGGCNATGARRSRPHAAASQRNRRTVRLADRGTPLAERHRTREHDAMIAQPYYEPRQTVLVLALDAARARLFWLEHSDRPAARLELHEDDQTLVNPEARLHPSERYTDSFSGGVRAPSGRHQGYEDHQNQNDLEQRMRFAREVANAVERIVRARGVDRLLVVASHAEHAAIVAELERKQLDCELRHTALEVTTLSPAALYDALQAHGLVH